MKEVPRQREGLTYLGQRCAPVGTIGPRRDEFAMLADLLSVGVPIGRWGRRRWRRWPIGAGRPRRRSTRGWVRAARTVL